MTLVKKQFPRILTQELYPDVQRSIVGLPYFMLINVVQGVSNRIQGGSKSKHCTGRTLAIDEEERFNDALRETAGLLYHVDYRLFLYRKRDHILHCNYTKLMAGIRVLVA